ncbi:MAG: hypothetical protein WAQ57_03175 [Candidatus Saccharimonadales bacterium]
MKKQNRLERLDDFAVVLEHYRPSEQNIRLMEDTPMVLLVGPTAAGRNTAVGILQKTGNYHFIVSNTTRHPRQNNGVWERDGVEYWFDTEANMLNGLKNGEYLEAAIIHEQQVSGTSMEELRTARGAGKIALAEIDIDGADHVHGYLPGALFVFLLPPAFDIWMQRLNSRGQMDHQEFRRRLRSAHREIAFGLGADYFQFVINNEINEASEAIDELAHGRTPDEEKQRHGREHAGLLMAQIQDFFEQAA